MSLEESRLFCSPYKLSNNLSLKICNLVHSFDLKTARFYAGQYANENSLYSIFLLIQRYHCLVDKATNDFYCDLYMTKCHFLYNNTTVLSLFLSPQRSYKVTYAHYGDAKYDLKGHIRPLLCHGEVSRLL